MFSDIGRKPHNSACFAEIIEKIRADDPSGISDLRSSFESGIELLLARRNVQGIEAEVALILSTMHRDVKNGSVSDPAQLLELLQFAVAHAPGVEAGKRPVIEEQWAIHGALQDLSFTERDALVRFYLFEQEPGQIELETGVSRVHLQIIRSKCRNAFLDSRGRFSGTDSTILKRNLRRAATASG